MSDVNIAAVFLEEAAATPFSDCFEGRPLLYEYVLMALGMERELEDRWVSDEDIAEQEKRFHSFTCSQACRRLAENDRNGWKAEFPVLRGFISIYLDLLAQEDRNAYLYRIDRKRKRSVRNTRKCLEEQLRDAAEREKNRPKPPVQERETLYAKAGRLGYTGAWTCFFFLGNVNMREYFQALSLLTGNKEDAEIPHLLLPYRNQTILNLLAEQEPDEDVLYEKIYRMVIEPFSKLDD